MVDSPVSARVRHGSHVTLHYRIAVQVDGAERCVVDTFGAQPATLTVGNAEIAEPLEQRLLDLAEGQHARFEFPSDAAFGARRPELVQTLAATAFAGAADPNAECQLGDTVRISDGHGREFSGVLKQRDADRVIVDFNHPLAGMPVTFTVHIIGVL
jgi:FKBP-type peptidyl-prolyl cis-trans isomerase SlpA